MRYYALLQSAGDLFLQTLYQPSRRMLRPSLGKGVQLGHHLPEDVVLAQGLLAMSMRRTTAVGKAVAHRHGLRANDSAPSRETAGLLRPNQENGPTETETYPLPEAKRMSSRQDEGVVTLRLRGPLETLMYAGGIHHDPLILIVVALESTAVVSLDTTRMRTLDLEAGEVGEADLRNHL